MGDTMRTHKTSSKKKTAAVVTAGVLGLATAGGAYAYWTTNGGGTGTASTSAGSENVFLVTGGVANAMFPGDSAQNATATIKNTASENYRIQSVTAYVTTNKDGCTGSDYKLNGTAAPSTAVTAVSLGVSPVDLAPAATTTVDFTLQFNNKAANQDACKGADVTLHYIAG